MLKIENWEYNFKEQMLKAGSNGILLRDSYKENGEWRVENSTVCVGHTKSVHGDFYGKLQVQM